MCSIEVLRHLWSQLPPKTTDDEMEEWNLNFCLHNTQSLWWLDTDQRGFLISCVDQVTARTFQHTNCDFADCKDKLEVLAGHFNEMMTPSFYIYTIVQAVTTNHTNDLRLPSEKLPQEIALRGGKHRSRSSGQEEILLLYSHHWDATFLGWYRKEVVSYWHILFMVRC